MTSARGIICLFFANVKKCSGQQIGLKIGWFSYSILPASPYLQQACICAESVKSIENELMELSHDKSVF
ncbi:hypothetical protein [Scytonema sp. NUACC21]